MKPFRKNIAVSIDGGGIKGVIVTRALAMLEEALGQHVHDIFRLCAGTSTGSIISAGIAAGLSAAQMYDLYVELGTTVFRKNWRSFFWPLTKYRYPIEPLRDALRRQIGDIQLGDLWRASPRTDLVITTFDMVDNRTRFIKPWKKEYENWLLVDAVLASSVVPTYFPIMMGRYVDGGVGSYANPSYMAAYETQFCLDWDPAETTLISLGTGRSPHELQAGEADGYFAWQWLTPVLGAFLQSADDQQVHLVETFFTSLDFRRFQVDLQQPIEMDDAGVIDLLSAYGEEMGRRLLNDVVDRSQLIVPEKALVSP